jgi:two-component system sensor histidine kinase HydH
MATRDLDAVQRDLFVAFEREVMEPRLQAMFRVRIAMLVLIGLVFTGLALADPSWWRIRFFLGMVVVGAVMSAVEIQVSRSRYAADVVAFRMPMIGVVHLALVFATGALESPFLPIVPMFTVLTAILLGPRKQFVVQVVLVITALWAFAVGAIYGWLPDVNLAVFGGGARAGHNDAHLWTSAVVASLLVLIGAMGGTRLRRLFDHMLRNEIEARQDELAAHTEHGRALDQLAGEIAHELKNPLAGVKLLAALVARDVDGKTAERVGVLRTEVDRMQAILEEFLNFSRPLVPLSMVTADLNELCADVAALHEGIARERGVTVQVGRGDAVPARCDPRKVRQVLINLVQNALDASPRAEVVDLVARVDGEAAIVEVLDRGTGVAAELSARIWDPGVTTKPNGSGLGLTIARALCRQHGGDLELVPREQGGMRAVVRVPLGGAA